MEYPGISIPGIELLDELGRGAHSVVLRAQRQGRLFAVKLPLDGGADSAEVAARIQREAVSLARVRHPVLPQVMEVGNVDQTPYIIMELATGRTLADRLRLGPLDVSEAVELARQLCGALAEIHRAGLIHRDVKPRNIIFDSQTAAVRLVDFGFVTSSVEGREREGIGTPAYAAPEQYRGTAARIDGRADLYSLGCVLLECLVGSECWQESRRWFQEYQNGGSLGVNNRIERLPLALQMLVGNLLARDPDERYSSAIELLRALDECAVGDAPKPARATRSPARGMLVGRQDESAQLRLAWAETRLGGGQIVVIRGAPGSGKTTFLRTFLDEVNAAGHTALQCSCESKELQPLSAIRQLLTSYVRAVQRLPDAARQRAIDRLRSIAGEAAPLLKLLVPSLGGFFADVPARVPNLGEQMVVETLADLLLRLLGEIAPSIVVVDDAQWIDGSSRRVLSLIAERSQRLRVLFVLAVREDAVALEVLDRLLSESSADRHTELRLGQLDDTVIADLVHTYLGAVEVDPAIIRECVGFSDRTPLGVLEVLRALLHEGGLRPHWGRWLLNRELASTITLPGTTIELLKHRVDTLSSFTQRVLTSAAVLGTAFADSLLVDMCQSTQHEIQRALAEARRAMLIESAPQGRHCFVHASVVDALLERLQPDTLLAAHRAAARAIDAKWSAGGRDWLAQMEAALPSVLDMIASEIEGSCAQVLPAEVDDLYAAANHYALSVAIGDSERAYRVNVVAGKLAFASFDNRRALGFFAAAGAIRAPLEDGPDAELEFLSAEAHSRMGALTESLQGFATTLEHAGETLLQARALSRIAWIQTQLDTKAAWAALETAFSKLAVPAPSETFESASATVIAAATRLWSVSLSGEAVERKRLETLCLLYYQTALLAAQTNMPGRMVQAVLRALATAEKLGPSSTLVRSCLLYAFMLTVLGRQRAAQRYLGRAQEISSAINDPATVAHVLEARSTVAAWAGNLDEALALGSKCLGEFGYWLELSEYCSVVLNHYQIESLRGRALEAWVWVEKAVQKVNAHERLTVIPVFLEVLALAALTALGRDAEADEVLRRMRALATSVPVQSGFELPTFGARIRALTERNSLGQPFEALIAEFERNNYRPERVHLSAAEYYVAVAHSRVHQAIHASESTREQAMKALAKALDDVSKAARIPLLEAHAHAVRGFYEWLSGDDKRAEKEFARAEALARSETAPWVLYAVHRGRAHMLRARGLVAAARDQALLAEAAALGHGAAYRAQTIRDEFKLGRGRQRDTQPPPGDMSTGVQRSESASSGARARRYLRALLRISQATGKELDPEAQARAIVDEIIDAIRAGHGFLLVSRPDQEEPYERRMATLAEMSVVAARSRGGHDLLGQHDYDRGLLELVIASHNAELGQSHRTDDARHEPRTMVAAPLLVRDQVVGVVYLERRLSEGAFNDDDLEALSALAAQIPVALELARTLTARERAEENLRSVQKMEAIARLAGGIAHDFNNMLAAIRASTDMLLQQLRENALEADVRTIQGATQRAEELTRQLLAFARGQFLQAQLFQLNDRLEHLHPTFISLLGDSIQLELRLHPKLHQVKADPAQIDQVLTNLVVNARDAMPNGGKLYIESANVVLDEGYSARNPQVKPGKYAMVSITDTGVGMDQEVMSRIFEPFYTTKNDRGGTGLGLAVAYGVVTQSEGHIEVLSKKGSGTTFNVYLPLAVGRSEQTIPPENGKHNELGAKTILLVEDEALVRESLRRALRRFGHEVLAARDAEHALSVARDRYHELDLLITDVLMPGMNGLELAREITKFCPGIKTLYISGYTDGLLAEQGVLRERIEYLQKPISQETLRARIDELFAGRGAARA